jgi:hypothetical protein
MSAVDESRCQERRETILDKIETNRSQNVEAHTVIHTRIDKIDNKFWAIILLLMANLASIATIIFRIPR